MFYREDSMGRVTPEEHADKLREHWKKNAKLRIA